MNNIYDGYLRRWSLNEATGQVGCFHDAVEIRLLSDAERSAIEAHNDLLISTANALSSYYDALRVKEPEEPHERPVIDEDGKDTGKTEPTSAYQAYLDAQAVIAETSDVVKDYHVWQQPEPEDDESQEWSDWNAARQRVVAALGNAPEPVGDIEQLTADRHRKDRINAERESRIRAGATFDVPGAKGIAIEGDAESTRNLQGLGMAALARLTAGDKRTITPFRDANDKIHNLAPEQLLALWQQAAAHVSAIYQASWDIKADKKLDHLDNANWP